MMPAQFSCYCGKVRLILGAAGKMDVVALRNVTGGWA